MVLIIIFMSTIIPKIYIKEIFMADIFNNEVGGVVLKVKQPSKDESGWTVIEQQSFTIDKKDFILKEFYKDFPNLVIKDFKQLSGVVSRSRKLSEWYSRASLLYADSIQLPLAFKDEFSPEQYKRYFKDMQSYKENLALETLEIQKTSERFKKETDAIHEKFRKINQELIEKEKIYPILTLNKSDLPISTQIIIEDYTPQTGDITQKRSAYAREILINYQKALIDLVKKEPKVDIQRVIDEMSTK